MLNLWISTPEQLRCSPCTVDWDLHLLFHWKAQRSTLISAPEGLAGMGSSSIPFLPLHRPPRAPGELVPVSHTLSLISALLAGLAPEMSQGWSISVPSPCHCCFVDFWYLKEAFKEGGDEQLRRARCETTGDNVLIKIE